MINVQLRNCKLYVHISIITPPFLIKRDIEGTLIGQPTGWEEKFVRIASWELRIGSWELGIGNWVIIFFVILQTIITKVDNNKTVLNSSMHPYLL